MPIARRRVMGATCRSGLVTNRACFLRERPGIGQDPVGRFAMLIVCTMGRCLKDWSKPAKVLPMTHWRRET